MRPLIVTAFFEIGRGQWDHLARGSDVYLRAFREYVALLPAKKYILGAESLRSSVGYAFDYYDSAEFGTLPSYRYLDPTRAVMHSLEFRALFNDADDRAHIEHRNPEYNVLMMMKWDALERAAAATNEEYTHYVWADFGLGRRSEKRPYLPKPSGFSPLDRDRIVISADHNGALRDGDSDQLLRHVRTFSEQAAGSLMIVPVAAVREFCRLARECYDQLLKLNLTTDDQLVIDMCVARRPDLFHLSFPSIGLTKFNHIHNIIHGLDKSPQKVWRYPRLRVARLFYKKIARRRIGL
jgi:hypothetical protein